MALDVTVHRSRLPPVSPLPQATGRRTLDPLHPQLPLPSSTSPPPEEPPPPKEPPPANRAGSEEGGGESTSLRSGKLARARRACRPGGAVGWAWRRRRPGLGACASGLGPVSGPGERDGCGGSGAFSSGLVGDGGDLPPSGDGGGAGLAPSGWTTAAAAWPLWAGWRGRVGRWRRPVGRPFRGWAARQLLLGWAARRFLPGAGRRGGSSPLGPLGCAVVPPLSGGGWAVACHIRCLCGRICSSLFCPVPIWRLLPQHVCRGCNHRCGGGRRLVLVCPALEFARGVVVAPMSLLGFLPCMNVAEAVGVR
jgi:hypothetical protein